MKTDPIRILVVDDSALYRQLIYNVLHGFADAQIVGKAGTGVEAIQKIEELGPDLLTLDVQMPDMDGIGVLNEIKRRGLRTKAIMVSSFTSEGAQATTDALLQGAFDFILKPSGSDTTANRQQLQDALRAKIAAFRMAAGRQPSQPDGPLRRALMSEPVFETAPIPQTSCQTVLLATSTGGPAALKEVLPKLPAEIPVPLLVVQHMPPRYTRSLAARLNEACSLEVVEAEDKLEAKPGRVVVAAGGKQMKLARDRSRLVVRVTDDPPENGVRPSADYLIRSAAEVLGGQALAIIMTGMGRDGREGCRQLKQAGGYVLAQSQDDCVVYGMPKSVIEAELADRVLPLAKIAPAIMRHLNRSRRL